MGRLGKSILLLALFLASTTQARVLPRKYTRLAHKPYSMKWALSYGLSTDFLEQERPRIFNHHFQLGANMALYDRWSLSSSLGAFYATKNERVVREHENVEFYQLRDFDIGLHKALSLSRKHQLSLSAGVHLPTSEASRYEGIRSIFYLNGDWKFRPWSTPLQFFFGQENYLVANAYDYSPVNNQATNDASARTKTGFSLHFLKYLTWTSSVGLASYHRTDGALTYGYGNSHMLSFSYSRLALALKYSNAGYTDKGEMDLWVFDQHRKLFSLVAMATF